ncbi:MAG: hypothetical protein H6686_02680 [Fibrobacteria bacterium]|nr:hypothetical protein [Fibrobacteria bacterium]
MKSTPKLVGTTLLVLSFLGCKNRGPTWIPVLGQPADRCYPDLLGSQQEPGRDDLLVGIQLAFADQLRGVSRPRSCAGWDWVNVCSRPHRVDSFFTVDSFIPSFGDGVGFLDFHFRNGDRYRACMHGRILPLDGAHWPDGQSQCPRSREELLQGLPSWCSEDPALVPAPDEEERITCRNYGICDSTAPAPGAPTPFCAEGRIGELARWTEGGRDRAIRSCETARSGPGGLTMGAELEVRQSSSPGDSTDWSFARKTPTGLAEPQMFRPAFARLDLDGDGRPETVFGLHTGKTGLDPVSATLVVRLGTSFLAVDGQIPVSPDDASLYSSTLSEATARFPEVRGRLDSLWSAFVVRLCVDPDLGLSLPIPSGVDTSALEEYPREGSLPSPSLGQAPGTR